MHEHFKVRKQYGSVYTTTFPNTELIVPWRLLSLEEYLGYEQDVRKGLIPVLQLEDEIFRKCVLDEDLVRGMDFQKSGIVHTVATHIWEYSGPKSIDSLNQDLEAARKKLFDKSTQVLHQISQLVLNVYPYKPEEVYAMDYPTLMFRAAQAENRLMELGIITEPVYFFKDDEEQKGPKFADLNQEKPKIDAKALWEQAHGSSQPSPKSQKKTDSKKWWKVSPVLESKKKSKVAFTQDRVVADDYVLDSHDRLEPKEMQEYLIKKKTENQANQMIEDAYEIYADLLKNLDKR